MHGCGGVASRVLCEGSWHHIEGFSELSDGVLVESLHLISICRESARGGVGEIGENGKED